jgi:predicted phosphate transport protein (TIGR00153 family)
MPPVYTATPRRADRPRQVNDRPYRYNVPMAFRLTPHERGFYPLFTRAAENIAVAADELAKLVAADPAARPALAARVKEAEHAGDELTHDIMVKINTTFVTPFDREDIYRLASALDDVIDAIEEAADRIVLYRLTTLPDGIAAQVEVLQRAAAATAAAMPRLEHLTELESYWIDVNSLEDEADAVYRTLLGDLLAPPDSAPPAEVLTILKTKEIVETLEEAADAFETVANTVASIAVKES